ncbi:nuclear hormone receptor HR96 [Tetranychus urticae]|uniref:nuclear hormone receptor HR96 n=1 Tax=Tetranychus urticae TaxID=32264 RepID=UPI00077BB3B3|nr:nuclear hormone receptor HR96 [Tetranychus urticae]
MNTRTGDELTCLVCSDRAMGNNFGAISCESCKAFFRRNAHDIEKLRCEFNGKCSITILTRRHCRRCRLEKCFQVGMRKDWILTEEQLQIRRARIQSRKSREIATRANINSPSSSSSSSSSSSTISAVPHLNSSLPYNSYSSTPFSSLNQSIGFHGPSTSHSSNLNYDIYSNLNDDEEDESDNDYEDLCDKMGKKIFTSSSNMLTSLLDNKHYDSQHDHHQSQSYPDLYPDYGQLTSPISSMVLNAPSFLSPTCSTNDYLLASSPVSPLPLNSSSHPFSSNSSSSLDYVQHPTNIFTKLEPSGSIEVETVRSKVYDLIMGSDIKLPINLSNEYITSNLALNQLINKRMDELINAYSTPFHPVPNELYDASNQESWICLLDYSAKLLIASIKNVTSFNRLPLQVRNDLFKESFSSIIVIRSVFLFDRDKIEWRFDSSSKSIKFNLLRLFGAQATSSYLSLVKDFDDLCGRNLKVGLILELISLFNSSNVDMQHQEYISKEKYIYTYLLRRYLESTGLSMAQARSDSYDLLMKLEQYKMCNKPLEHLRQICAYQSQKAGQLLSEILDLS